MSPRGVEFAVDRGVAVIELDRPDVANAFDLRAARAFGAAVDAASKSEVRAISLTGRGARFCGGGDVASFTGPGGGASYMQLLATELEGHLRRLSALPTPVVAGVQGAVAGAGLALVLNADLTVAGASTRFAFAYPSIGLVPDCGVSWLLPRVIGKARAMEMALRGRVLTAEEALNWGLLTEVVDDDSVAARTAEVAREIADSPAASALGQTRRLLHEAWETERHLSAADEIKALVREYEGDQAPALISRFLQR
ncbi:enoyl-CoA hydratase/isomerase family protein [Nocardioides sp. CN2-186]|uniref:enoyl-CoA hydratase/isomerase family protein n=1 Tax=Nocardioides tweenelious TaxID=3156607 RepID=UPI0032B36CE8